MARLWATILKELNTARTAEEFRGPGVKGPTGKGYGATGTNGTDFIVPDIEQDALTLTDTNNAYPIVSYASNGGVRHMPVVGYSVGGAYMTKLYREQCRFLFDAALRKRSSINPLGDLPSFQIDYCYWDSDPVAPRLVSDSYKGVKFGAFGLTVGAASPIVTCMFQLTGSTCTPITQTTPGTPNYGQEPACDGYPNDVFTFKDTKVYAQFDGTPLWTTTGGAKSWTPPAEGLRLQTVRSVSLNFLNTLATSSHNEGIVDRIQRTVQALQYSLVVDLVDPDASGGSEDNGFGSQVWREKYQQLRNSVESGRLSLGLTIERAGDTRISIDLGSRSVMDGYQTIRPIPDIFAAQISGFAMFDPSSCGTYDWDIADISGA
jgi:hypothetical protein